MKKLLLTLAVLAGIGLFTTFAYASFTSVPWGLTAPTDTAIFPSLVNGNAKGILVVASSTIGNGTQTGGLTISGGSTTTGQLTVLTTNTVAGGIAIKSTTGTTVDRLRIFPNANLSSSMEVMQGGASLSFVNSVGATQLVVNTAGNSGIGVATSSPFGRLAVENVFGDTEPLFTLASTTNSGNTTATTVFTTDNTGFTNIGGQANTSIAGDGRVLQAEGGDTFFGNESNIGTTIGVRRNNAFLGGFSTANSNFNVNGNGAGLSATGNNGLVIANTGTVPFSIGSSTPSNVYAKFSITTQTSDQTLSTAFLIASSSVANGTTTPFAIANTGWIVTSGPLPTATSCGTTNNISGNQTNGTVMFTGTLVTSCTVNFPNSVPVGTTLQCTESDNSLAATADISATTTNSVTFGLSTGLASGAITWNCEASRNANN